MKKNSIKAEARAQCPEMSPELFQKAAAKLCRWMKAAYGRIDWEACRDEMELDGIVANLRVYAAESESGDYDTFNRITRAQAIKGTKR